MSVSDLIMALNAYPPDSTVVFNGLDEGWATIERVTSVVVGAGTRVSYTLVVLGCEDDT